MPDVGVLELKIESDASKAAGGLTKLANGLEKAGKSAASFSLGTVKQQITEIVDAVKNNNTTVKSLGTLINAIAGFKKVEKIKFDAEPFEKLKKALGDGISLGQAGTQLKQLREALDGEWNTGNAALAGEALKAIGEGAKAMTGTNLGTKATQITKLADALGKLADQCERLQAVRDALGGTKKSPVSDMMDGMVQTGEGEWMFDPSKSTHKSLLPVNLQRHASGEISPDMQTVESAIQAGRTLADYYKQGFVEEWDQGFARGLTIKVPGFENFSSEVVSKISEMAFEAQKALGRDWTYGTDSSSYYDKSGQHYSTLGYTLNYSPLKKTIEATDEAKGSTDALKESIQQTSGAAEGLTEKTEKIEELFQNIESKTQSVKEAIEEEKNGIDSVNESLEEQIRIRNEMMAAADQKRLESNYDAYRDLFLSKEGNWEQQVPEMYGFTPRAIEEGETYADALRITMEEVNQYVDEFINKMNMPEGTLLRDAIDSANEAKLSFKSAQESAAILKNVQDTQSVAGGMEQVAEASQNMSTRLEHTKTATRVLTENLGDLDKELKQKKYDANSAAGGINNLTNNINNAANAAHGFTNVQNIFNNVTTTIREGVNRMTRPLRRFGNELWRIIRRMAIRAMIRQITSGIKEGVENMYWYSKAINSSFAPAMDSAATSLLQMKNSIGAALAPLLQSLIPVLQTVVNWFIEGVNYVNQFFALLNGQSTWTRALPSTTSAFEKQEKATKKASNAIKDLLADWDELNIIQSESTSGTNSSTQAATDYLSMFEEVGTFDNKVKKIVDYIKDNFDTIKQVAAAIGAAILAWRISNAFGESLGMLQRLELAAGLTLLITGIHLTAGAGYDIGKNGLNDENLLEAAGGVVSTMLGGMCIGLAFAGITGGAIGLLAGATLGLVILGLNIKRGRLDALYGNVRVDLDNIRKDLEDNFLTVSGKASIDITEARLKDTQAAEKKLAEAIDDLKKTYPVGVVITPDKVEDFKTKINNLVTATNEAIAQEKENFKIYVPASPDFTSTTFTDAWSDVEGVVTELSKKIGETINKGIEDNVTLSELQKKLLNISQAVLNAQNRSEFSGTIGLLGSEFRRKNFESFDRETIKNYIAGYNAVADEYMGKAKSKALLELVDKEKLVASLKAAIEEGEGIVDAEELNKLKADLAAAEQELEAFKKIGVEKRAQEYFDEWTLEGRQLLANDILAVVSNAMSKNNNNNKRSAILSMFSNDETLKAVKYDIEKYADYINRELIETIANESGMDAKDVQDMLGITGIKPTELFDDEFVEKIRNGIWQIANRNQWSTTQKRKIFSLFGFDFDEMNNAGARYVESLNQMQEEAKTAEVQEVADVIQDTVDKTNESVEDAMLALAPDANFDLLKRKVLQFKDHIETLYSETFTAGPDGNGIEWNEPLLLNFTPITPEGRKLDYNELAQYVEDLVKNANTIQDIIDKDKVENGGLGLFISYMSGFTDYDEAIKKASDDLSELSRLQSIFYKDAQPDIIVEAEQVEGVQVPPVDDTTYNISLENIMSKAKETVETAQKYFSWLATPNTTSGLSDMVSATDDAINTIEEKVEELGDYSVKVNTDALRDMINSAFADDYMSGEEKDQIISQFGYKAYQAMLKELGIMFEDGLDWGYRESGGIKPIGMIASNGMTTFARSGVAKVGVGTAQYNPDVLQPSAGFSQTDLANGVEAGTKKANETQNDLIRQLVTLATRIANKDFSVNVTPNSNWGAHNSKSTAMWESVTGG